MKLLLVRPYSLADLVGDAGDAPRARRRTTASSAPTCSAPASAKTSSSPTATPRASPVSELLPDGAKPSIPIDAAVVAIVDRWAVDRQ